MTQHDWDHVHAAGAHGHHGESPWSSPDLAGYLAGAVELPRTALDLGCGTGGDAVYLAERGIATTGVDISRVALERAATRAERSGVDVTWLIGDVLDLPVADSSIDLATDRGCLHHVAHDDQPTYAREVARVLRPGGRLLIREMNEHGRHEHAVSEDTLRAMIVGVPLRVVSVVPFDIVGGHGPARATLSVLLRD